MAVLWGPLAIAVGIPVGLGFGVSIISAPGLLTWFPKLKKPWWQPPAFLFGPIWSTLYTFMGLASYLVWRAGTPLSALAFKFYGAQLIFNLAWQPLFFNMHNLELAQIDNLAAFGFAVLTAMAFRDINRTAGLLLIPYIGFLTFANALNFSIGKLNPGGIPAGTDSSPLTEDLAHSQAMKNPGQDGYQPAQAALGPLKHATLRGRSVPSPAFGHVSKPRGPCRRPASRAPQVHVQSSRQHLLPAAGSNSFRALAGC